MRRLALAVGLVSVVGILLVAGQAAAQYRYTDDKGVSKTTQYKLDIPERFRDSAEWIGPTGIGKPGLSEEQRQLKLRDDAYRRIGIANEQLVPYQKAEEEARKADAAAAAALKKAGEDAAAAREARKAERRQQAQDAAQASRDRLQEESVRLQQEAVNLERQRQLRNRY
jgi:hypothetical protein